MFLFLRHVILCFTTSNLKLHLNVLFGVVLMFTTSFTFMYDMELGKRKEGTEVN